ncbi:hypothetical protein SRHO_G00214130 [Serrasalmus rhombeus]
MLLLLLFVSGEDKIGFEKASPGLKITEPSFPNALQHVFCVFLITGGEQRRARDKRRRFYLQADINHHQASMAVRQPWRTEMNELRRDGFPRFHLRERTRTWRAERTG